MPVPRKNEDEQGFISRCIPYVKNEHPSWEIDQCTAVCYSIWKNKDKKKEGVDKISREYIKMSFPLAQKKQVNESDGFELDNCVMLMTDTITGNNTYFPREEVEKVVDYWNGLPINMNHERDDIRTVVGHITDVKLEENRLMCKPVFDKETKEYDTAMGFIKSRFNAGDYPNVSVGLWADGTVETIGEQENVKVLRRHEPDHLSLVVHGSCDSALGCGIGIVNNSSVTIPSEEYVDLGIEELEKKLRKEIIEEEIKKLEEK